MADLPAARHAILVEGAGPVGAMQPANLRVLVVNFTLDEDSAVLASQASFVRRLAGRVAALHVVTELMGRFDPPPGVTITAIPRRPLGVPRRLGSLWFALPRILADIARFRPDVCFVHMAHEWCYRLGLELKRRKVPLLLWYTHKQVSQRLRLATAFADRIVTATPEGFRLPTGKVEAIGHGIDVDKFSIGAETRHPREIVSVGRISPIKRLDLIVEALAELAGRPGFHDARLRLVGPELTPVDKAYREQLVALAERRGIGNRLEIAGALPQSRIPPVYRRAALHVNVTNTGGLDKSVLEALACGCPVLTCNEAFFDTIAPFPLMQIRNPTAAALAERMACLMSDRQASPEALRALIVGRHDLDTHVEGILSRLIALSAQRRGRSS